MSLLVELISRRKKLARYSYLVLLPTVVSAVLSYFYLDQRLSTYYNSEHLMDFRKLSRVLTDIGLSENFFIMSASLFVIAHFVVIWAKRLPSAEQPLIWSWLKRWSLNFFLSLILSGILLHILKFSIGRQRPHVSDTFDSNVFNFFQTQSYFQSLPSGHSQVLFCVATMLHLLWPRMGLIIYACALFLAYTRVVVHAHFLSDVLVGAAVGHLGTLWSLWYLQKRFPQQLSLK